MLPSNLIPINLALFYPKSLDLIVLNIESNDSWGVEIKCPISKFNKNIDEVLNDKSFYLEMVDDRKVQLKRSHKYFYQIQGQLFCSGLKVDFVVWFGDMKPLHVETVTYHNNK